MKFKGFAEFGLLLASFSYALEKMAEEGTGFLLDDSQKSLTANEETFDDILKEFEKLEKETKHISEFIEPVNVKEDESSIKDELTEEMIEAANVALEEEETVDPEDLAVVNELRKRILEAFKEKEAEEENFEVIEEPSKEEQEEKETECAAEDNEEVFEVRDRFDVYTTHEQADKLKSALISDFDEYIADVKSIYGQKSRISKAIDSMVEHDGIMRDIKKLYPNLEDAFINEYYRLKDAINSENVEEKNSIILHRLSFNELNDLRSYADHIMAEGMMVNVDEKKLIADVIRPIVTKNGKVMADIFKVANTAAAYNGFYVGYLVK